MPLPTYPWVSNALPQRSRDALLTSLQALCVTGHRRRGGLSITGNWPDIICSIITLQCMFTSAKRIMVLSDILHVGFMSCAERYAERAFCRICATNSNKTFLFAPICMFVANKTYNFSLRFAPLEALEYHGHQNPGLVYNYIESFHDTAGIPLHIAEERGVNLSNTSYQK